MTYVIQDTTGIKAVLVSIIKGEPPSVEVRPIVGWLTRDPGAEADYAVATPVFLEDVASNTRVGLLCPEGGVVVPEIASYPSQAAFVAAVSGHPGAGSNESQENP